MALRQHVQYSPETNLFYSTFHEPKGQHQTFLSFGAPGTSFRNPERKADAIMTENFSGGLVLVKTPTGFLPLGIASHQCRSWATTWLTGPEKALAQAEEFEPIIEKMPPWPSYSTHTFFSPKVQEHILEKLPALYAAKEKSLAEKAERKAAGRKASASGGAAGGDGPGSKAQGKELKAGASEAHSGDAD